MIIVHTGRKIPGYEYRDIGTTGKEEAMEAMRMEQKGGE